MGSARIGAVVNGSGRIFATRSRIEKNDPAAMNSAKHIRHKCRARRGPAARHAESHDAHIASRRQDHHPGDEEVHHERDAVEQTAGAVEVEYPFCGFSRPVLLVFSHLLCLLIGPMVPRLMWQLHAWDSAPSSVTRRPRIRSA